MIEVVFTGFKFRAIFDRKRKRQWLTQVRKVSVGVFRRGMRNYPPSSKPGQYPAKRTGNLFASIRDHQNTDEIGLGSNMPYSIFLRKGTKFMQRRKMSDNALKEGRKQVGVMQAIRFGK